jgi:3-deoxy-7-phosphoheptulonate synthase
MRVYFEKPRTSLGWKGFINDPRMDDSFRIDEGMERARRFLLDVNELGLPAGTEALDPIAPQYYGDLIAWTAIGARTSESQTHREMSSGLSSPVGFKNGTDGDLEPAVNGIVSAASPHAFLGISGQGRSAIVRTRGNRYGHIVLRGGGGRPNSDTVSIALAEEALAKAKLPRNVVVDCSHANSRKKPELQRLVLRDVVHQIREGNRSVVGLMLESFLEPGNQPIPADLTQLRYGCSVTDACIGWDTTVEILRWADDVCGTLPRRARRDGDLTGAAPAPLARSRAPPRRPPRTRWRPGGSLRWLTVLESSDAQNLHATPPSPSTSTSGAVSPAFTPTSRVRRSAMAQMTPASAKADHVEVERRGLVPAPTFPTSCTDGSTRARARSSRTPRSDRAPPGRGPARR